MAAQLNYPNLLNVDIDLNFSVYHLVDRVESKSAVLQTRLMMSMISAEIENATILDGAPNRIFSSFQRMSRFLPQAERYARMAEHTREIYVFGIPDVDTLPDIRGIYYVPITAQHQLAREWFLVSYGTKYYSALATEELTQITDPDHERRFKGIWSFELGMVSTLHEWLSGVVGFSPMVSQAFDMQHDYPNQVKLMSNTIARMMKRMEI
jgi:DICT domain-containing protein